jgi:hypothetical protein
MNILKVVSVMVFIVVCIVGGVLIAITSILGDYQNIGSVVSLVVLFGLFLALFVAMCSAFMQWIKK